MRQEDALDRFIKLYKDALIDTKIGLILGAGVSKASEVPDYSRFALKAFLAAYESDDDSGFKKAVRPEVVSYIRSQLDLCAGQREVEPDEVFLLSKLNFRQDLEIGSDEWNRAWTLFCAHQLYKNCIGLAKRRAEKTVTDWRVKKSLYQNNNTLNALITFCAARDKDLPDPWKTQLRSSQGFREVGINPRVGGVLTTNYDSLFEAAFNHKFTKSKGRSYGLRPRLEGSGTTSRFDRLSVVHIHGYLANNWRKYEGKQDLKKRLIGLVTAETDYFKTFYESMRFSNYAAMSFMDSHNTLFVGCSMEDRNLRRFLFHLNDTPDTNTQRFAILKNGCEIHHENLSPGSLKPQCLTPRDLYYEKIMNAYGVTVIWLCSFDDIPRLLKYVYENAGGDWDYVFNYKRRFKRING